MMGRGLVLAGFVLTATASTAMTQSACDPMARAILVGSDWEEYTRALQALGQVPLQAWTIRGFMPHQWDELSSTDTTLPWTRRARVATQCRGRARVSAIAPTAAIIGNTTYPFGRNDAAVWAGRGVTAAATGGVIARLGALTLTLAPMFVAAQNARFDLQANGQTGALSFADWRYPRQIDNPQRFGNGPQLWLDPGQSSLVLDVAPLAAGVSTANQFWGPASDHPLLLGNNAAGFPHFFAQTAEPLALWRLGHVHGRLFYGQLSESDYSALADSGYHRQASGLVAVYQVPGQQLEIGVGRFFQVLKRSSDLTKADLTRPFGALFNSAAPNLPADQLASVFARLVLPRSGAELYGEYGREDASADMRDFLIMPDHDAAYLIGLHKTWRRGRELWSARGEILNSRVTHLAISSTQVPWYIHDQVLQGFTHRGQVLGSAAAFGGGGAIIAVNRYTPEGRRRYTFERLQLAERIVVRAPRLIRNDVAYVAGWNELRFGERVDRELGIEAVHELNRHFRKDVFNLRATLRLTRAERR